MLYLYIFCYIYTFSGLSGLSGFSCADRQKKRLPILILYPKKHKNK